MSLSFIEREAQMTQRLMVCLCFAMGILCSASIASAAECGEALEGGGEPPLATLELDGEKSDTEYKGDDEALLLRFKVSGCTLSSETGVEVEVDSSEVDPTVFGEASRKARRSSLIVRVPVDRDALEAGKNQGWVVVGGSAVTATTVPVTVQKKEDLLWPLLIGLFALIAGVIAAYYAAWLKVDKPQIKWKWLPAVVVPAAIGAGAVLKAAYFDVEVWKLEANTVFFLAVGMVSAAFGGAAAALTSNKVITPRRR